VQGHSSLNVKLHTLMTQGWNKASRLMRISKVISKLSSQRSLLSQEDIGHASNFQSSSGTTTRRTELSALPETNSDASALNRSVVGGNHGPSILSTAAANQRCRNLTGEAETCGLISEVLRIQYAKSIIGRSNAIICPSRCGHVSFTCG